MNSVTPKVLAHLQDLFPASVDVKQVSGTLGLNPDTVRGILPRLVARGEAVRTGPGQYKAARPRKPAEAEGSGAHVPGV